jgi:DNA ligase-1
MIKNLPVLYAIASTGKIKTWAVTVIGNEDGTAVIRKTFGYLDGTKQTNDKLISKGKNIGKANETTPFDQAVGEAQSAWNKKKDEKYMEQVPEEGKDAGFVLPMLAQKFSDRKHNIQYPAFAQPKLNGVRCFAKKVSETEISYTSRKGKSFNGSLGHLTPHLLDAMEIGQIFDGEIYSHGLTFQQIIRRVKKFREDSNVLQYWIYDRAEEEMTFMSRIGSVYRQVPEDHPLLIKVLTEVVREEREVYEAHDRYVKEGFEGVIIRNAKAPYLFDHRSKDLQKYKEFTDEEFPIVGGDEGSGNDAGCVIFRCRTKEGKEFSVRPRGSVNQRREWFQNLGNLVGRELTVRFQELSEERVPIFPVGIAIRDYE